MVTEKDLIEYKVKESLLFFTRFFYKNRYGRKFIVGEHHQIIADALERVLKGEITRLIINIAPRYGKTELAVKNFIAHGLALNPAAKFIHLTYAAKLALDNSEEAKDIVQDEKYQELFTVQIKKDSKAKDKWYTNVGGGVYAAAAGGQVTGFGAGKVDEEESNNIAEDEFEESFSEFLEGISHEQSQIDPITQKSRFGGAIIIDDPIKPEDGYSDIKRTRINERFETTIRNRVNSRKTPIIVIGQRVHEKDLSGYLMDVEPGEWTVIKLPCLKPDGTPLWSLKHTVEELQNLKRISPYVFEAQYQQDPKPIKKGGEFYKLFTQTRNTVANLVTNKKPELYRPELPLHLSFDFNVHPYMTCTIWQLVGKVGVQIDEVCLRSPRNRTEDVCAELRNRYPSHVAGMFIYGDPNGKKEDTRTEKGSNDYTIILRELKQYRPSLRVFEKAPPVKLRGDFINSIFDIKYNGINLTIGKNCVNTVNDYMFGREDGDGTKLKETYIDPATEIQCQKYHHCTDANDYFICYVFAPDFAQYQKAGIGGTTSHGKSSSKNGY